jgi:hypothetical protein
VAARVGLDKADLLEIAASLVDELGADELTLSRLAERLRVRSQSFSAHVDGQFGPGPIDQVSSGVPEPP